MAEKLTVFEIHLALCVETADIWNNPKKAAQLFYADRLDDFNSPLEAHAFNDTLPDEGTLNWIAGGLTFFLEEGLDIKPIVDRVKELAAHPERFDSELNKQQRIAYMQRDDKSCIDYYLKAQK